MWQHGCDAQAVLRARGSDARASAGGNRYSRPRVGRQLWFAAPSEGLDLLFVIFLFVIFLFVIFLFVIFLFVIFLFVILLFVILLFVILWLVILLPVSVFARSAMDLSALTQPVLV